MCNTNLTREQLISILSDAQQLVQNARSALTLDVAYKGTKEPALFGFYEDECKAVHKRVDAILEAAGVELVGDDVTAFNKTDEVTTFTQNDIGPEFPKLDMTMWHLR